MAKSSDCPAVLREYSRFIIISADDEGESIERAIRSVAAGIIDACPDLTEGRAEWLGAYLAQCLVGAAQATKEEENDHHQH